MSNNRLVITGLAEFYEALRNLPSEMTADAAPIVSSRADQAGAQIRAAYPEVTGNLKGHVTVTHGAFGRFGVASIVKSTAKHAYMYENGTQARQTDLGANRGAMPPAHVFVPIIIRNRREMLQQLIAIVEKQGLVVTGVV